MRDNDWHYGYVELKHPNIWNKCSEINHRYLQKNKKVAELREKANDLWNEINALGGTPKFANSTIITMPIPFSEFVEMGLVSVDDEGDATLSDENI